MPLGKRRKSVQGDGNVKECIGNRMIVDQKDDLNEDKTIKGGNKGLDASSDRTSVQPSSSTSATQTSEKKTGHIGAVTRSRVVKRPKRDLSPPESPVKKSTKEVKINTPETKTKRQWELWSTEDKETFFDGLFEHGKDFDAIQNVIAQKCKKKGVAPQLIKNKDQVRHFYYRTWHKICKYVQIEDAVKKETAELYGLINYGVLWKKHKAALTEKNGLKLDELVHTGSTTIKLKGKNLRIKTPCCNALKKLNNVDDSKADTDPRDKLPDRILLDFSPKTNSAWGFVQEMSQNPRLRILLKPQRKLSSIIRFLSQKWKPHRLKLKEELQGGNDLDKELTVFPHQECDVSPITMKATEVPQLHLAFNNYRENVLSSPSVSKGKKHDSVKLQCDNSPEMSNQAVIFDSPRSSKGQTRDGPQCVVSSIDVSALADGDNAMFPDDLMSSSGVSDTAEKQSLFSSDEMANSDKTASPIPSASGEMDNCASAESDKSPDSEVENKETRKMQALIEKGWTKNTSDTLSVAELYLMFGKDGKLRLEYDWCVSEENLTAKLTNMLRRLVHLAATEFTDFSKTTSTNSPCHSCGVVKARAGGKNEGGSKGQKAQGRYPIMSKIGEGMVDAATQTQGSLLQNIKTENASQGKDAVFRVPVASPAFLQKSTKPATNQISLSQMELLSNSHKTRRMRTVNRKPMVVQRTLLPKAIPRQMITFVPNVAQVPASQTIIGQPIGIPVSLATSGVPTNVIKVPNSNMSGNNLRLITSTTPVVGAEIKSSVSSSQSPAAVLPLSIKTVTSQQNSVSATPLPTPVTSTAVKISSISSTASALIHDSISPPSISCLLDMSLSNLPTADPDGTDKFLDLALENSNNFGALLDTTQDKPSSSVLNTPVKSANVWINGEDTGDMTFMNLLSDSPLKRPLDSSSNGNNLSMSGLLQSSNFFCENSRDSMMGRLDMDMQSMMNENSVDYVAKFADLAAHITQNDHVSSQQKKSNTTVHNLSDPLSRFDDFAGSECSTIKKSQVDEDKFNGFDESALIVNGNAEELTKPSGSTNVDCKETEDATMKLIEISTSTEIMDTST